MTQDREGEEEEDGRLFIFSQVNTTLAPPEIVSKCLRAGVAGGGAAVKGGRMDQRNKNKGEKGRRLEIDFNLGVSISITRLQSRECGRW